MQTRPRRNRIWHWIAIVMLAFFCVAGSIAFYQARQMNLNLQQAEAAELAHLNVDLSHAGTYQGPFSSRHVNSHGLSLDLQIEPGLADSEPLQNAMKGLKLDILLTDSQGRAAYSDSLDAGDFRIWQNDKYLVPKLNLPSISGLYTLFVTVKEPAAGLAGRNQTLVGKYMFCGLEHLPVTILRALAVGAWIIAVVIGIVLLVRWSMRRNRVEHHRADLT